jgi:hypothetical protein
MDARILSFRLRVLGRWRTGGTGGLVGGRRVRRACWSFFLRALRALPMLPVREAYVAGRSWAVVVGGVVLGLALAGLFWGRRALGALLGRGGVVFVGRFRTLGGFTVLVA